MQSEVQQRIVLQILLDCIYKQIDRSEIEAAVDITIIHNLYANCLNDLSYNESNNQITSRSQRSTYSFDEQIYQFTLSC